MDDDKWLGYQQNHPDYITQGLTLDELKENLKDIHNDITGGLVPKVRTVEEMEVTRNAEI